ncbi:GNAT family N-acetyltransferase [[Flexibacter] sp. ATCC 35208]|uniref:GNAT family N-acetyltransferase n=1 Tax=[Flexibacter] sp. ATCC 35208 TaxID=1936242 RepID=UPI0009C9864B|nr:hypothetical protein [[Flexibacter] sp. ATCC 35208]OMP74615.1 hypothetical protein BW716_34385 [[Flexibacter] sp. ATCC 35208]
MCKIKSFPDLEAFAEFNKKLFEQNYFVYYYFQSALQNIFTSNGSIDVYDFFNLSTKNDCDDIICLFYEGNYIIMGNYWDSEILECLIKRIDFSRFHTRFHFSGKTSLLVDLFNQIKMPYKIYKDREIMECKETNDIKLVDKGGKFKVATMSHLPQLIKMLIDYYATEWHGDLVMSKERAKNTLQRTISREKVFIWEKQGKVLSMASIINENKLSPIIGGLYTPMENRNNRYATNLLTEISKRQLASKMQACCLISDKTNNITSKIFQKIGYLPIYEWTTFEINSPN